MLVAILVLVVIAYAAACAALFLFQRALVFFPQPRALGTHALEAFRNGDTLLQLTVRTHAGPGAVLYFGGNAEDVSGSLEPLVAAFPDREIVMLHYRGYGGSAGEPGEEAIAADAAALFDRVHAQHPDVVVVGRSLGTGVALRLASIRPATRVVLVTPYDSMVEIAQSHYRLFPVYWLMRDKFESWRYVPQVKVPTRIIAAGRDEVIPAASTERLRARFAPGQASYVLFPDAGHNTLSAEPGYVDALAGKPAAGS